MARSLSWRKRQTLRIPRSPAIICSIQQDIAIYGYPASDPSSSCIQKAQPRFTTTEGKFTGRRDVKRSSKSAGYFDPGPAAIGRAAVDDLASSLEAALTRDRQRFLCRSEAYAKSRRGEDQPRHSAGKAVRSHSVLHLDEGSAWSIAAGHGLPEPFDHPVHDHLVVPLQHHGVAVAANAGTEG